jgi:TRAP-type C4-dicarboxylate transport system substrate-binding protein
MALVANLDDWNSLTPALQASLMRAAEEVEQSQWRGRQAYIDQLVSEAQDQFGAQVMNPPQAEVDRLLAQIGPILADWKRQVGPDSARALAALDDTLGTHYQ